MTAKFYDLFYGVGFKLCLWKHWLKGTYHCHSGNCWYYKIGFYDEEFRLYGCTIKGPHLNER